MYPACETERGVTTQTPGLILAVIPYGLHGPHARWHDPDTAQKFTHEAADADVQITTQHSADRQNRSTDGAAPSKGA